MTDEGLGASRLTLPGGRDVSLARAPSSSVDEGDAWLTPAEATILGRFRVTKRAADWRLGRWVAKEAVAWALGGSEAPRASGPAPHRPLARAEIEILAGPGGGPRARILAPGAWPAVAVSLSHVAGVGFAVAAVARDADAMRLGCDIEEIAPRSEAFVSDYFTAEEAAWIRTGDEGVGPGDRHVRANLLWSAKESALKALGEGLRKDTRSVVVEVEGMDAESLERAADTWRPLSVASSAGERFAGWWRVAEGLVWTVVG